MMASAWAGTCRGHWYVRNRRVSTVPNGRWWGWVSAECHVPYPDSSLARWTSGHPTALL